MQIPALLDLEQFPDSPYASELRRDFPDLRFSPALEKDFQRFHLDRVRSPVPEVLVGWLGLAVPVSVFLLWASWGPFYERLFLPASRVALPLLGVISAVGIACRILVDHPDPFYFLTSYSIALFFLGGQLFREALIANALMILAHGATLAYVGEPIEYVVYYVSVLSITAAVGAFVYRGEERQLRTSFLERG